MKNFIRKFQKDEDGAVTVDWVVLTAGVVGLGIAALTVVSDNTAQLSADVGATVDSGDPFYDMSSVAGVAGSGS